MAIGGDDRVVRVDADTLVRLKTLQGELTASTGLKFRIGDVVRRATQALAARSQCRRLAESGRIRTPLRAAAPRGDHFGGGPNGQLASGPIYGWRASSSTRRAQAWS